MAKINRKNFFERVRAKLFTGKLTQSQTDGLTAILNIWEERHASKDDRWLAYALATTFHETAFTMKPIHELGGRDYFFRMYDRDGARPAVAAKLGNTQPGDGILFHGRGYVQLTGRRNYTRMGTLFGVDLVSNETAANRALEPGLAARIMFQGMEAGLFTQKKFADFFKGDTADWKNARKIINGLDSADKIAVYGREFYDSISYTV